MARIPVSMIVQQLFASYDANRNGRIDLAHGETFRATTESLQVLGRGVTSRQAFSARDVFVRADANRDGVVTRAELTQALLAYDTDGDSELRGRGGRRRGTPADELGRFEDENGPSGERLLHATTT